MERAFQHLKLSHSQIEQACRQYFQNKGSLQSFKILSGGAVNATFKIRWDNKWYVLRFYVRAKDLVSIEKQVYQLVQATVPVPKMLFASSSDDSYPFSIFRLIEKPHIHNANKTQSHHLSYDLGCVLAKIHAFCFPQAGLFGQDLSMGTLFERGSRPYLEYCLEHLTPGSNAWMRLGDSKAKQVIRFIEEHQEYFPIIHGGGCLVHSDFKPVNLLWDEKCGLTRDCDLICTQALTGLTVLDWEFAHSGDGIMDFGILLRHFQEFPLSTSHLEKGYQDNGGHLAPDWIQRARITDFINIVQLLNGPSERPKLFRSLIQSLDFTVMHWKELSLAMEESCFKK